MEERSDTLLADQLKKGIEFVPGNVGVSCPSARPGQPGWGSGPPHPSPPLSFPQISFLQVCTQRKC